MDDDRCCAHLCKLLHMQASGAKNPRAIAVVYTARGRSVSTVRNLRTHFPDVPIWARALDLRCAITCCWLAIALRSKARRSTLCSSVTQPTPAGLQQQSLGRAEADAAVGRHAADLTEAGATTVIVNNTEAGTAMGSSLLSGLGVARESQLAYLTSALRKQMEARCANALPWLVRF